MDPRDASASKNKESHEKINLAYGKTQSVKMG